MYIDIGLNVIQCNVISVAAQGNVLTFLDKIMQQFVSWVLSEISKKSLTLLLILFELII